MTQFVLGTRSLQRLQGVHPDLVRVIKRAIEITQIDFAVNEGLRTLERQRQLVKTGASQTLNSKHLKQPSGYGHAVDLVPYLDTDGNGTPEISWHWPHFYPLAEAVRQAAKELGVRIRWGGCWGVLNDTAAPVQDLVAAYTNARRRAGKKAFIDGPHFELA
ncbi:MAG: M15 family metallopeptidase [Neisseria sp.]|nr:M15 family metallopeptidase [Neisseria sp.]